MYIILIKEKKREKRKKKMFGLQIFGTYTKLQNIFKINEYILTNY